MNKVKEFYVSPFTGIYAVRTGRALALSYNQTERTETLSWDVYEEDL
jgi:hypothetical protein